MNAVFSIGKVKVGTEGGDLLEKEVEMVTLSGGYLGKDDVTRPSTADDHLVYAAEYEAFKAASTGALPSAVVVPPAADGSPAMSPDATGAPATSVRSDG